MFDCFDGTLVAFFKNATTMTADPPEKPSRTIVEIINDVDDLSILKMLLKKAATVQALEDFSDAASVSGVRS